jgi:hypothetical protein
MFAQSFLAAFTIHYMLRGKRVKKREKESKKRKER